MFLLGALGGVLPIIVSMVTVDLAPIIDGIGRMSPGIYIGYGLRVFGLLLLGGLIAALNNGVQQPLALVQLGIAAPALVTSYINTPPAPTAHAFQVPAIISRAHADELARPNRNQLADGLLGDIVSGFGSRLDAAAKTNLKQQSPMTGQVPVYPASPAAAPEVVTGQFCQTANGRFGPGPAKPLGTPCNVDAPNGAVAGVVSN
jgi:hypothetical protein